MREVTVWHTKQVVIEMQIIQIMYSKRLSLKTRGKCHRTFKCCLKKVLELFL